MNILSVEWELGNWSWGLVAQNLMSVLGECSCHRIEFLEWRKDRTKMRKDTRVYDIILSQNVSQLQDIPDMSRVLARLGGNMSFVGQRAVRIEGYLDAMRKCRAVIATNNFLKRIAEKACPFTYLIPNGIGLEEWKYKERRYSAGEKFIIGFSGNVSTPQKSKYKGYDIISSVCRKMKDVQEYGALFKQKQIPFERMQHEFYGKIHAIALLTDGEGSSNTLMEACACGVPIITTRSAGYHGEMMVDGVNVIFTEKDASSFRKAVERLMGDPELYERVSKGARQFAEEHHDIRIIANKYREVFRRHYPECFNEDGTPKEKVIREGPPVITASAPLPIVKPAVKKPIVVEKEKNTIVACVLRTGGDYTPEYVHRLKRAVERNLTVPHDFVCFSNIDIPGINVIPLEQNWAGWWSKVELFRLCSMFPGKRYLCLDLDTVIISNIDTIGRFQNDGFAMLHGIYRNRKEISGGLMLFKGDYSYLYEMFAKSKVLQDIWFARKREDFYVATTVLGMDKEVLDIGAWIKYASWKRDYAMYRRDMVRKQDQIICFHGKPRPLDVKENYILREHWRL